MRVAFASPRLFPEKSYFEMVAGVQKFVFLDTFPLPRRRGWVHRSRLRSRGKNWDVLSVPIVPGPVTLHLKEVKVDGGAWIAEHIRSIVGCYGSPAKGHWVRGVYSCFRDRLEDGEKSLSWFLESSVTRPAYYLGAGDGDRWEWASKLPAAPEGTPSDKLVHYCRQLKVTECVVPASESYLYSPKRLRQAGIPLTVSASGEDQASILDWCLGRGLSGI